MTRAVTTSVALERSPDSRLPTSDSRTQEASYSKIDLAIDAAPLQQSRARELAEPTRRVLNFYSSLLGDMPFKTFTLAVIESDTPGGHSPAYFATLNQPPPAAPLNWRNDPAYFEGFPEFFLAHELAHQWWGQAVGWKSYHEQWLSEGFAQYFAVLYAERFLDRSVFDRMLRQLTRWTLAESEEGPVYLGSRLGHIQNDSRIFRALAYNKGALVLHMLRRLVGDDAFFRSLTRFYSTWRFRKAGTEDLKEAFEAETNRSLDRFFERWIYNASLPRIRFGYELEDDAVRVRLEQVGQLFDIPVTVTLQYANARFTDVMVPVTEAVTELRIPIEGVLRNVFVDRDDIAPAEFVR
jgi:predicted metalloprotease with PDZ domain